MRRVWKNRRDAAAEGTAPAGWLDRTFDWLDGRVGPVLNKVPLGRSHYDQETAEREWRERFGDDGFETDGASWESTTGTAPNADDDDDDETPTTRETPGEKKVEIEP